MKILNARIVNTELGFVSRDCPSFFLAIDCQEEDVGMYLGGRANPKIGQILRILEVAGVKKWEDLKGSYVRAMVENHEIVGIMHILDDIRFFGSSLERSHDQHR